jgi:hypothetical protein
MITLARFDLKTGGSLFFPYGVEPILADVPAVAPPDGTMPSPCCELIVNSAVRFVVNGTAAEAYAKLRTAPPA